MTDSEEDMYTYDGDDVKYSPEYRAFNIHWTKLSQID